MILGMLKLVRSQFIGKKIPYVDSLYSKAHSLPLRISHKIKAFLTLSNQTKHLRWKLAILAGLRRTKESCENHAPIIAPIPNSSLKIRDFTNKFTPGAGTPAHLPKSKRHPKMPYLACESKSPFRLVHSPEKIRNVPKTATFSTTS